MSINPFANENICPAFLFNQDEHDSYFELTIAVTVTVFALAALGITCILKKTTQPLPQTSSDRVTQGSQAFAPDRGEAPDAPLKGYTPPGTKAPQNMTAKAIAALERQKAEREAKLRKKEKKAAKRAAKVHQPGLLISSSLSGSNGKTVSGKGDAAASETPLKSSTPLSPVAAQDHDKPDFATKGASYLEPKAASAGLNEELLGSVDWDLNLSPRRIDGFDLKSTSTAGPDSGVFSTEKDEKRSEASAAQSQASSSATSETSVSRREGKPPEAPSAATFVSKLSVHAKPFDPLYKPALPRVSFKATWERQFSHHLQLMEETHAPLEGGEPEVAALVHAACQFAYDNYERFDSCREFLQEVNRDPLKRIHVEKGLHQFLGPEKCHFRVIIGNPLTSTVRFHVNLKLQDTYPNRQAFSKEPINGTEKWDIRSLT